MILRLMIPVAGTIAALLVIAFAREERDQGEASPTIPPFDFPDAPEHAMPEDEEEVGEPGEQEEPEAEPPAAPAQEPKEYQLELKADGTIFDVQHGEEFESLDDLQRRLGDARHRLILTNGAGVTEAALDTAFTALRSAKLEGGEPMFQVRKVYRAPEAPAAEGR